MAASESSARRRRLLVCLFISSAILGGLAGGLWRWCLASREHAYVASCKSNLKGIALDLQMHLDDWDDTLPPGSPSDPYYWVDGIYLAQPRRYPDMGRYFSMWRTPMTVFCPKHARDDETIERAARAPAAEIWRLVADDPIRYLSYAGILGMGGKSVDDMEDLTGVPQPEIPFVFETAPRHMGGRNVVMLDCLIRWMPEDEFASTAQAVKRACSSRTTRQLE